MRELPGAGIFLGEVGPTTNAMPVSSRCSSPSSSSSSSSPTTTITTTLTETGADAVAQRRHREANDEGSVDRRREFARLQDARRRAYRETTSLRVFPLQAMAMEDHCALMRGYHHNHRRRRVDDASDDDDADGDGDDDVSSVGGRGGGGEDSRSSSNKKGGDDDDDAIAVDVAAAAAEAEVEAEAEAAGEQTGRAARRGRPRRQRPPPRDDAAAIIATKSCSTLWSVEPRLFAMETSVRGRRRYLSGHLGRFVDRYWRECDVGSRHYYELIKEGSPCRLYFGE